MGLLGHDSGWIDTPVYTDVNLVQDTLYAYRVKARDRSAGLNETGWSDWALAQTPLAPNAVAPTPESMQFDPNGLPQEINLGGGDWDYWATMTAVTAIDDEGLAVQYYFECRNRPDLDSGWIDVPTYTVYIRRFNQSLEFRVRASDPYGNTTAASPWQPMRLSPIGP